MVGVSVACSSIELVPSVIEPTVQWWLQMVSISVACSFFELVPTDLLYHGGYRWWGVSVACSSIVLVPSVDLLYSGGYRWWGVSVACSSIELVPTVIRPTVPWWIQMAGVSAACSSIELVASVDLLYSGGFRWWGITVACSSMELVPIVIRPAEQWWIQMVGYHCHLFLCVAVAECNRTYCTVLDTDGSISVSPVPL